MTRSLRRDDLVHYAADITVRMQDRDDYIVRSHEFVGCTDPRGSGGLIAMLRTWRRYYGTRRQLSWLDARGFADIGIDTACATVSSPSRFRRFD
jgi:uncharacterized protein YjiS (DUF1127 family)